LEHSLQVQLHLRLHILLSLNFNHMPLTSFPSLDKHEFIGMLTIINEICQKLDRKNLGAWDSASLEQSVRPSPVSQEQIKLTALGKYGISAHSCPE